MWLIIGGLIIGFIIYSFMSDNEKLKEKVDKQGGMRNKYALLIENLSLGEQPTIIQENRDNITIAVDVEDSKCTFFIMQAFRKVGIRWNTNGVSGTLNKTWEFDEHMNQETMGIQVLNEMMMVIARDIPNEVAHFLEELETEQPKSMINQNQKEIANVDTYIHCDICNDTQTIYLCSKCRQEVYFDMELNEFCENCPSDEYIEAYEAPCSCTRIF
jgi:hypothetical protein